MQDQCVHSPICRRVSRLCKTSTLTLPLLDNQSGFVLVMAMLVLVILVIIGTSATKNSQMDLQIAGNDKISKQNFYRAESGIQLGSRMVEENTACPSGFSNEGVTSLGAAGIAVANPVFWQNAPVWVNTGSSTPETPPANSIYVMDSACPSPKPSSTSACYAPQAFVFTHQDGWPSNVAAAGTTSFAAGSAVQMVSGYEGKGKGAAAGGGKINYSIVSQGQGARNSLSEVEILWQHVIGLEGECGY